MNGAQEIVHASGGIVVGRTKDGGVEVALIHRPAYDDWTFPKGKRLQGEDDRQTALREVQEETGLVCRIERPVGRIQYRDRKDRPKTVKYWLMTPLEGTFHPTSEVDEIRWLQVEHAEELLTYGHDRTLLLAATQMLRDEPDHGQS